MLHEKGCAICTNCKEASMAYGYLSCESHKDIKSHCYNDVYEDIVYIINIVTRQNKGGDKIYSDKTKDKVSTQFFITKKIILEIAFNI